MATTTLKTVPKISVKIWRPIIEKLDKKLDAACLRRDAYLRRVLEVEASALDCEVVIPNSKASNDHVFAKLDEFDRKLLSLALPAELTERLNAVCARKRIVRDAFFNRLFLLLAAAPKVIDSLLFSDVGSEWRREVWSEYKHDGPFFQNGFYPLEPEIDPFWAIRAGLEHYRGELKVEDYVEPETGETVLVERTLTGEPVPPDSLYTTVFHQKGKDGTNDLVGMSCYLPDWLVPGHNAVKAHQAKLDELLGDLVSLP